MIVHLYGPDAYRRHARLRELIAAHEARHSRFSVAHVDAAEPGAAERLAAFLANASLFASAKLAVVHADELDEETARVLEPLGADATATAVIVSPNRIQDLPRGAESEEFSVLEGSERLAFIRKEAGKRGIALTPAMMQMLSALPDDSWGIATELDTIALGGTLAPKTYIPEFFPLVQSLRAQAASVRLAALAYLLDAEEPAKVFNILAALLDTSGKRRMADYDIAVKSGKLEYEEALLDYVLGFRA